MSFIDWSLVLLLNGSIIVYALFRSRDTRSSSDWFLAGRSLPWWMIGISLYATAIDSTDLVVDAGAAYGKGLRYFVANWLGVVGGWLLLAHLVVPKMYRAGMYTNAEYLEARFEVTARIISVLVQVIYRTVIIAMIGTTNFLTLVIVCNMSPSEAWLTVGSIALSATVYTMLGGLKSVAVTDALQSVVMLVAAIVFFVVVWGQLDGWGGIRDRLASHDPALPDQVLRVGTAEETRESALGQEDRDIAGKLLLGYKHDQAKHQLVRSSPVWLGCISLLIAGMAYSIVNHTQSMRLLGARSLWHAKMAVVPAGLIMILVTFLNLTMGIMGKALYPELDLLPVDDAVRRVDAIYPVMIREFTDVGLKGLVVAGLFAAAFSTYDSIGSTLSALITRDVYGRLLVKDRDDHHYLTVARWLTPVIVFGSFLYVPALQSRGMIFVYLDLVGSFVVPLLAVYLMGTITRVHRSSATIGLVAGVAYGVLALLAPRVALHYGVPLLPTSLMDSNATAPITFSITCVTMLLVSVVRGWQPRGEVAREETGQWLAETQRQLKQEGEQVDERGNALPIALALVVIAISLVLTFGVFW